MTVVAVDGGHARGQTPYAWTGPVRSTRRPGRSTGPLLGLEFFRDKAGMVKVTVAPKALKRAQDHRQLTMRNWRIAIRAADQGDQPVHGRTDGVLLFRRHFLPFDKLDKWPRRRLKAGAPEGVEAHTSALLEPPGGSVSPPATLGHGRHRRRAAGASPGPGHFKGALPNTCWHKSLGLKGFLDPYRGFRESWANRSVRTRMPDGVGGARASLASTRFCAGGVE